jgi:hypothetical protein
MDFERPQPWSPAGQSAEAIAQRVRLALSRRHRRGTLRIAAPKPADTTRLYKWLETVYPKIVRPLFVASDLIDIMPSELRRDYKPGALRQSVARFCGAQVQPIFVFGREAVRTTSRPVFRRVRAMKPAERRQAWREAQSIPLFQSAVNQIRVSRSRRVRGRASKSQNRRMTAR